MASSISNSGAANRSITESKIPFWHLEIGAEESTVATDLARKRFSVGLVTLQFEYEAVRQFECFSCHAPRSAPPGWRA